MNRKTALVFAAAAVVSSIVCSQRLAHSTTYYSHSVSSHAITCKSNNPLTIGATGQVANVQSTGAEVFCPIDTNERFMPRTDASIHVFGYGNGGGGLFGNSSAAACSTWFWGGGAGGKCGPSKFTSQSPGSMWLTPDASAWGASEDAKYIYVYLGGRINGSSNVIWSYSVNQLELTP